MKPFHITEREREKKKKLYQQQQKGKKLHAMLFCYCEAPSLHILLSLVHWVKWEQIRLDIIFSGHFVFLARASSIVIHCDRLQATKLIEMCNECMAYFLVMKKKEVGYWRFRWPACNSTLFVPLLVWRVLSALMEVSQMKHGCKNFSIKLPHITTIQPNKQLGLFLSCCCCCPSEFRFNRIGLEALDCNQTIHEMCMPCIYICSRAAKWKIWFAHNIVIRCNTLISSKSHGIIFAANNYNSATSNNAANKNRVSFAEPRKKENNIGVN